MAEISTIMNKEGKFQENELFISATKGDINQINIELLTGTLPCYQIRYIKVLILAEAIAQTLLMVGTLLQGLRNRSQQHLLRGPNLEILCFSKQIKKQYVYFEIKKEKHLQKIIGQKEKSRYSKNGRLHAHRLAQGRGGDSISNLLANVILIHDTC